MSTRRSSSVLWVNDTPDERIGNGIDPAQFHGHVYKTGRHVVAVSFEAENGTCVRVNFNPLTGEVSTQNITEAQGE